MTNTDFLNTVSLAFSEFLTSGSRSNKKLIILHGAIARDLQQRFGNAFEVHSLGFSNGKEKTIQGRYIDKRVDITITKQGQPIAGIGVKFIMQNYSQNSNNYFENMLGETANIRSNNVPYFQIFVIPDTLPYHDDDHIIKKWETFSVHNAKKYVTLSSDNPSITHHTPNKTLLYVVHLPDVPQTVYDRKSYVAHYKALSPIAITATKMSYGAFQSGVVVNDYEEFAQKTVYYILSI